MGGLRGANAGPRTLLESEMDRDKLIRETKANSASWPALVGVYGIILGAMILSALAIV